MEGRNPDALASMLAQQEAWPKASGPIEYVQTHISHVFLVGKQVFKLRKSVQLPFLDFSTRSLRNEDCLREFELNRRLAPSVYLGIAPVLDEGDGVAIGQIAPSPLDPDREHVVVMRRLAADRDALTLLEEKRLSPRDLEAVAKLLAEFHARQGLGQPAPWSAQDWLERNSAPILANLESLADSGVIPGSRLAELEQKIRDQLDSLAPDLEQRRAEGRAIDGHGDLHLDHVFFETEDSSPLLIDCLEFNEDLRKVDAASEVAFLAMDLRYRDREDLAEWFLSSYASETDDYGLFPVVNLFSAYRAMVRAKVAALASLQTSISEPQRRNARTSAQKHLTLAESLLEFRPAREIVVLCGTVGSGKSTVARHLAQSGQGIAIASDRVRKAMAGVATTTHSHAAPDEGLYTPEQTEAVYQALLERASAVAKSGRTPILDASFATRAQRERIRSWAVEQGLHSKLLEVRCDSRNAHQRLEERARRGTDASDAGPDFLPISEARYEEPQEWPKSDHRIVWTDRPGWEKDL